MWWASSPTGPPVGGCGPGRTARRVGEARRYLTIRNDVCIDSLQETGVLQTADEATKRMANSHHSTGLYQPWLRIAASFCYIFGRNSGRKETIRCGEGTTLRPSWLSRHSSNSGFRFQVGSGRARSAVEGRGVGRMVIGALGIPTKTTDRPGCSNSPQDISSRKPIS